MHLGGIQRLACRAIPASAEFLVSKDCETIRFYHIVYFALGNPVIFNYGTLLRHY